MKAGTIHILDLDFEFKLWKNRLYHFQSEIEIIKARIFVLVREHPGFQLSKSKQKLLDNQSELVKVMLNKIENMEQEMALFAEDYPVHEKHSHYILHENIRKDMIEVSEKQHEIIRNVYPDLCYPKVMKI